MITPSPDVHTEPNCVSLPELSGGRCRSSQIAFTASRRPIAGSLSASHHSIRLITTRQRPQIITPPWIPPGLSHTASPRPRLSLVSVCRSEGAETGLDETTAREIFECAPSDIEARLRKAAGARP